MYNVGFHKSSSLPLQLTLQCWPVECVDLRQMYFLWMEFMCWPRDVSTLKAWAVRRRRAFGLQLFEIWSRRWNADFWKRVVWQRLGVQILALAINLIDVSNDGFFSWGTVCGWLNCWPILTGCCFESLLLELWPLFKKAFLQIQFHRFAFVVFSGSHQCNFWPL